MKKWDYSSEKSNNYIVRRDKMEKYSAMYYLTDCGFVIQNINREKQTQDRYYPLFCVIKNMLYRGTPTGASQFLINKCKLNINNNGDCLYLIADKPSRWINTIKGDDKNQSYPAKVFIEKTLPRLLPEYSWVQTLILPEVLFSEIVGKEDKKFVNEQVDFYLPQAKLVIEIDGMQHQESIQVLSDRERDEYLLKNGIKVVRIPTSEITISTGVEKYIEEIKDQLVAYQTELTPYYNALTNINMKEWSGRAEVKLTAIMRFQILIIELLMRGYLKLDQKEWHLVVNKHEPISFEREAIEDLFIWMSELASLMQLPFHKPNVQILTETRNEDTSAVMIDFSILKRYCDENRQKTNIIFVRNDYFPQRDYYQISTAPVITYPLDTMERKEVIKHLTFFLKNIFLYDEFRPGQVDIITNILVGRSTIGLLPTGSGKSICYQLSCLLQPCISFVVAPIKSLMEDQKYNMINKGINHIDVVNSNQNGEEKQYILHRYQQGRYNILLISPERFQTKTFRESIKDIYTKLHLAYAIIDEVHCLSEWGHDFRTSYLHLCPTIRRLCPNVKLIGLTATASQNVLKDIATEFQIGYEDIKTTQEYTRRNLTFDVRVQKEPSSNVKKKCLYEILSKKRKEEDIFNLQGKQTKSGLIFSVNKVGEVGCYNLANEISNTYGIAAKWYCGECPQVGKPKRAIMTEDNFTKYKQKVQEDFIENKFPLLVATKAFGMGIDKSNIRYTIHYGLPGSLEALYQEAGRAGRDGKDATCYVLYNQDDIDDEVYKRLFGMNTTIEEIEDILDACPRENEADILRNFFLWKSSNKGENFEKYLILTVFKNYGKVNKKQIISLKEVKSIFKSDILNYINIAKDEDIKDKLQRISIKDVSFSDLQKAIYKLTLLGIVDDWTVEDWQNKGKLEVQFSSYSEESVLRHLEEYIQKYEADFSFEKPGNYYKYAEKFKQGKKKKYNLCIEVLVEWGYDQIFYSRRQTLQTLKQLCEKNLSPEQFKQRIEHYFNTGKESTVLLDIVENPSDYSLWFKPLIKNKENGVIFSEQELLKLQGSLSRFLESYRYNAGLNYLSGILGLLTGNFDEINNKPRLIDALKQIKLKDEKIQKEILTQTLDIGKNFSETAKSELGDILCSNYKENVIEIYDVLKDESSLYYVMSQMNKELEMIGGNIGD